MISRGSKSPTRQLLPMFEVFSCVSAPRINSCYCDTNWLPPDFYKPHRGNTVQVALYLPSVRGELGWLLDIRTPAGRYLILGVPPNMCRRP